MDSNKKQKKFVTPWQDTRKRRWQDVEHLSEDDLLNAETEEELSDGDDLYEDVLENLQELNVKLDGLINLMNGKSTTCPLPKQQQQ